MQPRESSAAIRTLLDYLGWNQTQMGKELGVSRNLVSMMAREEDPIPASKPVSLLLRGLMERYPQAFGEADGSSSSRGRPALKEARLAKKLTVQELAKLCHYSVATYQDIEDGRSNMSEKQARKVAKVLGIDVSILMDGAEETPSRDVPFGTVGATPDIQLGPGMEDVKVRFIPLLSWAQCGRMATAFDDTAYTHEGFISFDAEDRKSFAVHLTGDSMAPIYGPGDTAIVYPSFAARNGDLVIARLKDEVGGDVMFKIYQGNTDEVTLTSYNPAYAPMTFPRHQLNWIYPVDQVNKKVRRHHK